METSGRPCRVTIFNAQAMRIPLTLTKDLLNTNDEAIMLIAGDWNNSL